MINATDHLGYLRFTYNNYNNASGANIFVYNETYTIGNETGLMNTTNSNSFSHSGIASINMCFTAPGVLT